MLLHLPQMTITRPRSSVGVLLVEPASTKLFLLSEQSATMAACGEAGFLILF